MIGLLLKTFVFEIVKALAERLVSIWAKAKRHVRRKR